MSLLRLVFIVLFINSLAMVSCEDKKSKKKIKAASSILDSLSNAEHEGSEKKESIIKKVEKEPFRLTNKNMNDFLLMYGEDHLETLVRIKTEFGDIDIQLFKETPLHRANFLYLVNQKYFDQTFFYRVSKDFVIQGGNSDREEMAHKRHEIGRDYTIPQEQIKGVRHDRGTVALSKQWVDNPSNRSTPFEFFIVVSKKGAYHLDGEHTIFGNVVQGMDVVDKISDVKVDSSEWPLKNIHIEAKVIR